MKPHAPPAMCTTFARPLSFLGASPTVDSCRRWLNRYPEGPVMKKKTAAKKTTAKAKPKAAKGKR